MPLFRSPLPKGKLPFRPVHAIRDVGLMSQPPKDPNKFDAQQASYNQDPDQQLEILGHINPTLSASIHMATRAAAAAKYYIQVTKLDGSEHPREQKLTQELHTSLTRVTTGNRFTWRESLAGLLDQAVKLSKLRGGLGMMVQLDKRRRFEKLLVIDPVHVAWEHVGSQTYIPFYMTPHTNCNSLFGTAVGSRAYSIVSSVSGKPTSLDLPNFSYNRLDGSTNHPFCVSPLTPVLTTIYQVTSFMQSLGAVADRVAWPRISVKMVSEKMAEMAKAEGLMDEDEIAAWMDRKTEDAANLFQNLKSDTILVHGDYIDPSVLSAQDQGANTIDPKPLLGYLGRMLAQGSKSFGALLGETDQVDPLQAFFQMQSIRGVQQPVADCMSHSLTFMLRALGHNAVAKFVWKDFEMKPPSELQASRVMKQRSDLVELAGGSMTPREWAIRNGGSPPPRGDSVIESSYNNIELFNRLVGAPPAVEPSDSDAPNASPAKGGKDSSDGRRTERKAKNVRGKDKPGKPKGGSQS